MADDTCALRTANVGHVKMADDTCTSRKADVGHRPRESEQNFLQGACVRALPGFRDITRSSTALNVSTLNINMERQRPTSGRQFRTSTCSPSGRTTIGNAKACEKGKTRARKNASDRASSGAAAAAANKNKKKNNNKNNNNNNNSDGDNNDGAHNDNNEDSINRSPAISKKEAEIRQMVHQVKSRNLNNGGGRQAKGGRWMAIEDKALRAIVHRDGEGGWRAKAKELNDTMASHYEKLISNAIANGDASACYGRVAAQCLHRWKKVLQPGLKRGHWDQEEDKIVRSMVERKIALEQKIKWSDIAKQVSGRLGKQCRERWVNHLDPSVTKVEWTSREDEQLFNAQAYFGPRWCEISKFLPGRTANDVKNRYNSSARQRWLAVNAGAEAGVRTCKLFVANLKATLKKFDVTNKQAVAQRPSSSGRATCSVNRDKKHTTTQPPRTTNVKSTTTSKSKKTSDKRRNAAAASNDNQEGGDAGGCNTVVEEGSHQKTKTAIAGAGTICTGRKRKECHTLPLVDDMGAGGSSTSTASTRVAEERRQGRGDGAGNRAVEMPSASTAVQGGSKLLQRPHWIKEVMLRGGGGEGGMEACFANHKRKGWTTDHRDANPTREGDLGGRGSGSPSSPSLPRPLSFVSNQSSNNENNSKNDWKRPTWTNYYKEEAKAVFSHRNVNRREAMATAHSGSMRYNSSRSGPQMWKKIRHQDWVAEQRAKASASSANETASLLRTQGGHASGSTFGT